MAKLKVVRNMCECQLSVCVASWKSALFLIVNSCGEMMVTEVTGFYVVFSYV